MNAWTIIGGIALFLFIIVPAVKVVWQYEKGVMFRFGKLIGERGPGLNFIIPYVDRMIKMDMRVETLVVEPQEVITRDNVTVEVDAVVYCRVVNASDATIKVKNYIKATGQFALTTLRSVLGQSDLDELLSKLRIRELYPVDLIRDRLPCLRAGAEIFERQREGVCGCGKVDQLVPDLR